MIGKNSIVVVPGAKTVKRNADTEYPFRQESNFSYLTGFPEPNALLIVVGGDTPQSILLCDPKNEAQEIWTGKRFGPEGARLEFGFDQTCENTDLRRLREQLRSSIDSCGALYYPIERDADRSLREMIDCYCLSGLEILERSLSAFFLDSDKLIGEMRLIKDKTEVTQMIRAADISAEAYRYALKLIRPGMTEIELEAEFTYRFRRAGGDACHAYQPIVAAGANACTLHHVSTDARTKPNELVLIDAGCEYQGYASDITRTFPVEGTFNFEQRILYALVLAAQKAAIKAAQPGKPLRVVHEKATEVICEGLMAIGLLKRMNPLRAVKNGEHRPFFPHGTSHWLGLDVHDSGDYRVDSGGRKQRKLEAGMVITVEPGIYIQPGTAGVESRWQGIGIRIEDDVLITGKGNRVLTKGAPKEIDEIEALMRG